MIPSLSAISSSIPYENIQLQEFFSNHLHLISLESLLCEELKLSPWSQITLILSFPFPFSPVLIWLGYTKKENQASQKGDGTVADKGVAITQGTNHPPLP